MPRAAPVVQGALVLWVDDRPGNNVAERRLLRSFNVFVDIARSTGEALDMLDVKEYDCIISDMERDGVQDAGLQLLSKLQKHRQPLRTILYVLDLKPEQGTPGHGFAITNRPDELVHYLLDVLERERS